MSDDIPYRSVLRCLLQKQCVCQDERKIVCVLIVIHMVQLMLEGTKDMVNKPNFPLWCIQDEK